MFIDPILSRHHDTILGNIEPSHRVIDIACGTGSQSIAIAEKAHSVTGIDLSEEMIGTALRSARRKKVSNVLFELRDASDLSYYKDNEFDVAITSKAVHQFDAEPAVKILSEMKRIASQVIIVDYNYPIPKGLSRTLAFGIERIAGGDHYRNFRVYMKNGGITYFANRSGLKVISETVRGSGVFIISVLQ
jgi:ubiquinone/menaquinone biosynthesis C-methylase UbiE